MGRYEDFWQLTEDALLYASESLKLELTAMPDGLWPGLPHAGRITE